MVEVKLTWRQKKKYFKQLFTVFMLSFAVCIVIIKTLSLVALFDSVMDLAELLLYFFLVEKLVGIMSREGYLIKKRIDKRLKKNLKQKKGGDWSG